MEVDFFSIVVVIIAFSFFLIPIVIDKMRNKDKSKSNQAK
jgi:hypothetical protein